MPPVGFEPTSFGLRVGLSRAGEIVRSRERWSPRPESNRHVPGTKRDARAIVRRGPSERRGEREELRRSSGETARNALAGSHSLNGSIGYGGVRVGSHRANEAEPVSGIEPEPPEYETGARPIELRGQVLAVRAPFREQRRRERRKRRSSAVRVSPKESAATCELEEIDRPSERAGFFARVSDECPTTRRPIL